jgi:hypothetical protein
LLDGAQDIARARDVGEVDLGLDLFFAVSGARRSSRGTRRRFEAPAKMFPHQVGFEIFQRAGVGFLLGYAHRSQHVKNFPALDFQLTG